MTYSDKYSVLMSVSGSETPAFLKDSLMSLFEQTMPTDDLVLVVNGQLPAALNAVVKRMKALYKDRLRVIDLSECGGAETALGAGLKACRHDLVALMDSVAFAAPERCERQLKVFETRPVTIVGTALGLYDEDPEIVTDTWYPAVDPVSITKLSRRSNPFYRTTVMMNRTAALKAGGFDGTFPDLADYHLWVRMLMNGGSGYNIPEKLVLMRAEAAAQLDEVSRQEQLGFEKWKKDVGWTKLGDYVRGTLNVRFAKKR